MKIRLKKIGTSSSADRDPTSATSAWHYGRVLLGIILVGLSVQLASMWVRTPHSTSSNANFGQAAWRQHHHQPRQQQQQQLLDHPAVAVVAEQLNCTEALAGGREYTLEAHQLSRYSETDGRPLLLDNRTNKIMSWILNNEGEKKVHEIFRHLLSTGCDPFKVFVDVGANAGFYSLVALSYACQVLAFDPQPACAQLFKRNMCLNAHYPSMVSGTGIAVVNRPVSDVSADITMMVASTAATPICEGTFSVDRQHKSAVNASAGTSGNATAAAAAAAASFTKTTVSLDELLLDSTLQLHLVKIDTEGFELSVLRSMRQLLAAKRVAHMMVEVTPLFWARDGVARGDVYKVFLDLMELNCTVQRALDVDLPSNMQLRKASGFGAPRVDTPAKLREYLVERDFVQEDVFVSCLLPDRYGQLWYGQKVQ